MTDEEREVTSLTGGIIDGFASYLNAEGFEGWKPAPPLTADEILAVVEKVRQKMVETKYRPREPIMVTPAEYAALRRRFTEKRTGHVVIVPERHGEGVLGTPLQIVQTREESTIWQEIQRAAAARVYEEAARREVQAWCYFGIPADEATRMVQFRGE